MAIRKPESMDECFYFTRRDLEGGGDAMAWVYRTDCPECGKAKMGKPRDPKTGKPKIRSKEYQCPECGFTVDKEAYEETLICEIKYTCPACKKSGEASVPFQRKRKQVFDAVKQKKVAVDAILFNCSDCGHEMMVTKKMKM